MSNPLKAIGKAFKAVVRVVKKIALPALAIGAVLLTGGAALGLLGTGGLTGALGSLGLSPALTGVLATAAKSATFGAIGAAITGQNIVKGASLGFVTGGVLGGIGAVANGAKGLGTVASAANSNGGLPLAAQGTTDLATAAANAGNGALPIAAQGTTDLATRAANVGLGSVTSSVPAISSAAAPSSGGILGWMNQNPVPAGMMVQGLGQGIMASEQNKAAQREREQIAANYGDTSGLPQYQSQGNGYARAGDVFNAAIYAGKRVTLDPKTGLKVAA